MPNIPVIRPYRRKHFYKVTWSRSEKLLADIPWLKGETREFCVIGYRQPTNAEAQAFIGSKMYDRLYDQVVSVQEITKEEALRDFQMEDWRYQKVFGAEERTFKKQSLDVQIEAAVSKSADAMLKDHEKESVLER